jgi:hypothetical protein
MKQGPHDKSIKQSILHRLLSGFGNSNLFRISSFDIRAFKPHALVAVSMAPGGGDFSRTVRQRLEWCSRFAKCARIKALTRLGVSIKVTEIKAVG